MTGALFIAQEALPWASAPAASTCDELYRQVRVMIRDKFREMSDLRVLILDFERDNDTNDGVLDEVHALMQSRLGSDIERMRRERDELAAIVRRPDFAIDADSKWAGVAGKSTLSQALSGDKKATQSLYHTLDTRARRLEARCNALHDDTTGVATLRALASGADMIAADLTAFANWVETLPTLVGVSHHQLSQTLSKRRAILSRLSLPMDLVGRIDYFASNNASNELFDTLARRVKGELLARVKPTIKEHDREMQAKIQCIDNSASGEELYALLRECCGLIEDRADQMMLLNRISAADVLRVNRAVAGAHRALAADAIRIDSFYTELYGAINSTSYEDECKQRWGDTDNDDVHYRLCSERWGLSQQGLKFVSMMGIWKTALIRCVNRNGSDGDLATLLQRHTLPGDTDVQDLVRRKQWKELLDLQKGLEAEEQAIGIDVLVTAYVGELEEVDERHLRKCLRQMVDNSPSVGLKFCTRSITNTYEATWSTFKRDLDTMNGAEKREAMEYMLGCCKRYWKHVCSPLGRIAIALREDGWPAKAIRNVLEGSYADRQGLKRALDGLKFSANDDRHWSTAIGSGLVSTVGCVSGLDLVDVPMWALAQDDAPPVWGVQAALRCPPYDRVLPCYIVERLMDERHPVPLGHDDRARRQLDPNVAEDRMLLVLMRDAEGERRAFAFFPHIKARTITDVSQDNIPGEIRAVRWLRDLSIHWDTARMQLRDARAGLARMFVANEYMDDMVIADGTNVIKPTNVLLNVRIRMHVALQGSPSAQARLKSTPNGVLASAIGMLYAVEGAGHAGVRGTGVPHRKLLRALIAEWNVVRALPNDPAVLEHFVARAAGCSTAFALRRKWAVSLIDMVETVAKVSQPFLGRFKKAIAVAGATPAEAIEYACLTENRRLAIMGVATDDDLPLLTTFVSSMEPFFAIPVPVRIIEELCSRGFAQSGDVQPRDVTQSRGEDFRVKIAEGAVDGGGGFHPWHAAEGAEYVVRTVRHGLNTVAGVDLHGNRQFRSYVRERPAVNYDDEAGTVTFGETEGGTDLHLFNQDELTAWGRLHEQSLAVVWRAARYNLLRTMVFGLRDAIKPSQEPIAAINRDLLERVVRMHPLGGTFEQRIINLRRGKDVLNENKINEAVRESKRRVNLRARGRAIRTPA
jgi:hypothetical protein